MGILSNLLKLGNRSTNSMAEAVYNLTKPLEPGDVVKFPGANFNMTVSNVLDPLFGPTAEVMWFYDKKLYKTNVHPDQLVLVDSKKE